MTIPRHVAWANRDPQYKGDFSFEHKETVTIGAGGYTDVHIQSGVINCIYRIDVSPSGSNPWRIKIFDKDSMDDADRAFDSGAQSGNYNTIDSAVGLIVQPDKDMTSEIHMRVFGTVSDIITIVMNIVRLQ
jgi:hypothetical protein